MIVKDTKSNMVLVSCSDLAGNNIMELEDNIFETNCRLRSLILSGNPLKTISSEAFTGASIEHL